MGFLDCLVHHREHAGRIHILQHDTGLAAQLQGQLMHRPHLLTDGLMQSRGPVLFFPAVPVIPVVQERLGMGNGLPGRIPPVNPLCRLVVEQLLADIIKGVTQHIQHGLLGRPYLP